MDTKERSVVGKDGMPRYFKGKQDTTGDLKRQEEYWRSSNPVFPPIPSLPPSINPNNPEIIKKFYILFFICTSLGPEILNIIPSIGIYYYRMMITGFC